MSEGIKTVSSENRTPEMGERKGGRRLHLSVVECDAQELSLFYDNRDALVHPVNVVYMTTESWATQGGRDWLGEDVRQGFPEAYEDCRKVLQDGWPRGVERVQELVAKLRRKLPEPESARRKPRWGDEGDDLDRDKLYSGQLDTAWRTTTRVKRRAPRVVRIAFSWGMSCFASAEQLANSAASLMVLADLLEAADYQTEIVLCGTATHGYGSDAMTSASIVHLKHAGDALNPNNIAIAGHAGIFRTFGFHMICAHDRPVDCGLGHPSELAGTWKQLVDEKMVLPVDAIIERCTSMKGAENRVIKALREILGDDYAREAGIPDVEDDYER